MKTSILHTFLQASILGLLVTRTIAQSATVEFGPITTLACYNVVEPSLQKDNTNTFQTSGLCQPECANKGHAVMAITGGTTCYCGDELPPLDQQVDESKCDMPCGGFGQQNCGGIGYWTVYLSGISGDVQTARNATISSSSSAAPTPSIPAPSKPAETVVVTAAPTSEPLKVADPGPSKVGIAVGVVVGVLALATLIGATVFFMKQKRRREIEEEHKAQAAVNSFVGSKGSDSKSDARLDPSMASSFRRESIGSIADERDFSRRILQVRNPDRGSMNSMA